MGVKSIYLDRCLQLKQDRLGDENFPRLCAKITDFRFQKLDLLSGSAAPHLQQSVNDRIQIHVLIGHGVLSSEGGKRPKAMRKKEKKKEQRKVIKQASGDEKRREVRKVA